uniref:Uncharacterized protein n=1 Tax=Sipha flava TaxID=143950 RepID=A0A2S2QY18_9HEMI
MCYNNYTIMLRCVPLRRALSATICQGGRQRIREVEQYSRRRTRLLQLRIGHEESSEKTARSELKPEKVHGDGNTFHPVVAQLNRSARSLGSAKSTRRRPSAFYRSSTSTEGTACQVNVVSVIGCTRFRPPMDRTRGVTRWGDARVFHR